MSIGERIRKVRTEKRLTMEKFASRVGMSSAALSKLENDKNAPSGTTIVAICREFGVNDEWLKTGEGEMYGSAELISQLSDVFDELAHDPEDSFRRTVFLGLAQLDPEDWEMLRGIVEKILGK